MQQVTDSTFQLVLGSDKATLVYIWADWCGPCKMMSPVIEAIASEHSCVNIVKVNADESPKLLDRYGITSVPTLLLFKNGNIVESHVGALPKFRILGMMKEHS